MKNLQLLLICLCGTLLIFSSCERDVSLEKGLQQIAEGSLHDSAGNCMPANVHGTYYTGVTPGSDTAYIQLQVDVTKTGTYSIMSNLENGLQFADSGYFTTTGENTILLKPIGIPIFPITSTFTVTFDSSLCNFTLTTLDSTGLGIINPGTGNNNEGKWQFLTDLNGNFSGTNTSAFFVPDTLANGTTNGYVFEMLGYTANGDSAIDLQVLMPQNVITPGTYNTLTYNLDSSKTTGFEFCPTNGDDCYYFAAGISDAPTVKVTINIASYDNTTKIVSGTFSGIAVSGTDFNGDPDNDPTKTIQILNGSFTATVSP